MINDLEGLLGALAVLELRGGDTDAIEAKAFSEYSAQQLGPTLSAFANMPGGGVILLGVSERDGITVVGVDDVHGLLQRVADQARKGFSAPVRIDALPIDVDGKIVGVVNVEGADANEKPVRWLKDRRRICVSMTVTIRCRRRRSRCFSCVIGVRAPTRRLCPVVLGRILMRTWSPTI